MIGQRNEKKTIRTKKPRTTKIIRRRTLRRKMDKIKDRINADIRTAEKCTLSEEAESNATDTCGLITVP
jgi:hypothetical protein